jgi:hypothetical protein
MERAVKRAAITTIGTLISLAWLAAAQPQNIIGILDGVLPEYTPPAPEPPPESGEVGFSPTNIYQVDEDAGTVTLTVARVDGTETCDLTWATMDGTALAGTDYTAHTDGLQWLAAANNIQNIVISITDRAGVQTTRQFTVVLSDATCPDTITPTTATVTILDTDPQSLAAPWLHEDVGSVQQAGDAFTVGNVLTCQGQGDVNNDADAFHAVYQPETSGDYDIRMRVLTLNGVSIWRRVLLAVRDEHVADSSYVSVSLDGTTNAGTRLQYKLVGGTGQFDTPVQSTTTTTNPGDPLWLRIVVESGLMSVFESFTSADGPWASIGTPVTPTLTDGLYFIEVECASGGDAGLATATVSLPTITALGASAGTLEFSAASQNINEDTTPATITVTRSGGTAGAAAADVTDEMTGSAVGETDFDEDDLCTVSWMDGEGGSRSCVIDIIDRAGDNGDRDLDLVLANEMGATLGAQTTYTLNIIDTDTGTETAVKWHPGVYRWPNYGFRLDDPTTLNNMLADIDAHANDDGLAGFKVTGDWAAFEGATEGDYEAGFDAVDALVARAQSYGKRIIIHLQSIHYGGYPPSNYLIFYPAYMVAPGNGGVCTTCGITIHVFNHPNNPADGLTPDLWNTTAADKALAMVAAYGARYDANPFVEEIGFTGESSVPMAQGTNGFSYETYLTQLKRIGEGMRAAAPHTNLRFMMNFVNNAATTADFMDWMAQPTVYFAWSQPDVVPAEASWFDQRYVGASMIGQQVNPSPQTDHRTIIPYTAELQTPELCNRKDSKPSANAAENWQPADFYSYMMVDGNDDTDFRPTQPSHWIIAHEGGCGPLPECAGGACSHQEWNGAGGFREFVNDIPLSPPLKTTCPTAYPGCVSTP